MKPLYETDENVLPVRSKPSQRDCGMLAGHCWCKLGTGAEHHDNDLGLWILSVDPLDELGKGIRIDGRRHVVCPVLIIRPNVDDDEISWLVFGKVPGFWVSCVQSEYACEEYDWQPLYLTSIGLGSPPRRVRCIEPLVNLTTGISPAVLVCSTDSRIGRDRIVCVS